MEGHAVLTFVYLGSVDPQLWSAQGSTLMCLGHELISDQLCRGVQLMHFADFDDTLHTKASVAELQMRKSTTSEEDTGPKKQAARLWVSYRKAVVRDLHAHRL